MKKLLKRIALGFSFLFALIVGIAIFSLTNPSGTVKHKRSVEVKAEHLRQHVVALIGQGFRTGRHPQVLAATANYIRDQWESHGFEVEFQTFVVEGESYQNVITSIGPAEAPRLIIGAHYDVVGEFEGADDNASGVAGLFEIARLLKENPVPGYRIDLVAYGLHEPPYFGTQNMGSAIHAKELMAQRADVRAMISLDSIGYFSDESGSQRFPIGFIRHFYPKKGNFIAVVGDYGSFGLTRAVKARLKGACDVSVYSLNGPSSIPGVDFSDHRNYWKYDIPAVLITDTAYLRNAGYHRVGDTIDTLDFERMADVVEGIYAAVTTLKI